jgi:ubiquinone/menaquinone biosynthesis C-methylase UbiE
MEVDADVYNNLSLAREECALLIETALMWNLHSSGVILPACGTGRHAHVLSRHGFKVYAMDISSTFLDVARSHRESMKTCTSLPTYTIQDIRKPTVRPGYKICALLGGSFGYFDLEGNKQVLKAMRESTPKGGFFIFDVTDQEYAIQMARKYPLTTTEVDTPSFGTIIDERTRVWDKKHSRMLSSKRHSRIACRACGDKETLFFVNYAIEIYSDEVLKKLLSEAGFTDITKCKHTLTGEGLMKARNTWVCR